MTSGHFGKRTCRDAPSLEFGHFESMLQHGKSGIDELVAGVVMRGE